MSITSIGYDGTITEPQLADWAAFLGRAPCVAAAAAWKVTAVPGPARTVRVAVGSGYGDSVLDTSDATVDVQLAAIASGTRWDTVVARRDWTPPGGVTVFTAVTGTTTQALAAGLLANPGVSADQPLALVQLTAGSSTPTAVVDLRALPTQTVSYPNTLALPAGAPTGATADVAGRLYVKGVSVWARRSDVAAQSASTTGHSITTSTAPLSVTGGLTTPVSDVARVITVNFAGMCTSLDGRCDFQLHRDGVSVRIGKVDFVNQSASGGWSEVIPAGVSLTFQLRAKVSAGGSAFVPNDAQYVYLTASLSS